MKRKILIFFMIFLGMILFFNAETKLHISQLSQSGASDGNTLIWDGSRYLPSMFNYNNLTNKPPVLGGVGIADRLAVWADSDSIAFDTDLFWSGSQLGINTSSPNYEIHAHSSTAASTIQVTNSLTGSQNADGFQFLISALNTYLYNYEAGFLTFGTDGTRRLTIAADGNVGIGVTNPNSKLDIAGDLEVSSRAGTATSLAGWDSSNRSADITVGNGLSFNSGTLSANPSNVISFFEFKTTETVTDRAVGNYQVMMTGGMAGRTITELRASANVSVPGSTTIQLRKNGVAQGSGITVTSTTPVSETLNVTIVAGDVLSLTYSGTSGTLFGSPVSVEIQ